jgi:hypothetical protein
MVSHNERHFAGRRSGPAGEEGARNYHLFHGQTVFVYAGSRIERARKVLCTANSTRRQSSAYDSWRWIKHYLLRRDLQPTAVPDFEHSVWSNSLRSNSILTESRLDTSATMIHAPGARDADKLGTLLSLNRVEGDPRTEWSITSVRGMRD